MKPTGLICALILSAGVAFTGPAKVFNVHDFGAIGNGKTLDTAAIQKALNACKPDGGTVELPAGKYLSQPLTIYSRTVFKLDAGATLFASTNQMDFMKTPGNWLATKSSGEFSPFIGGKDLTDVTFTGGGTIDGNGFVWWPAAESARQKKIRLHTTAAKFGCHRALKKFAF